MITAIFFNEYEDDVIDDDDDDEMKCKGIERNGGALQRSVSNPPPGGGLHHDLLHRQRGAGRHLLQRPRHQVAHLRRPQPPRLTHHVRGHHLS